jgi:hypothetical protein
MTLCLYFSSFLLFWAHATSFYPQPFPETVQKAPTIVRGKVGMSYSDWGQDRDKNKRIFTYFELQISEVIKGPAEGSSLMMRELGGEKDGTGLHIPGASQFERGEDVIVFLQPPHDSENVYDVYGMMMGKYTIQTNGDGEEYLQGPGLFSDNPAIPNSASSTRWTLNGLKKLVQTQGQKASPTPVSTRISSIKIASPSPSPSHSAWTSAASQLQNSQLKESASSQNATQFFPWIEIGGAVALGLLLTAAVLLFKK